MPWLIYQCARKGAHSSQCLLLFLPQSGSFRFRVLFDFHLRTAWLPFMITYTPA